MDTPSFSPPFTIVASESVAGAATSSVGGSMMLFPPRRFRPSPSHASQFDSRCWWLYTYFRMPEPWHMWQTWTWSRRSSAACVLAISSADMSEEEDEEEDEDDEEATPPWAMVAGVATALFFAATPAYLARRAPKSMPALLESFFQSTGPVSPEELN